MLKFGKRIKKMKKIFLIALLLLLPFSGVNASEINEVLPPEIYCYSSSSNGHSCINVIIINDQEILRIAELDESELTDEFGVTQNDSLQIQFDYSIDDSDSWNYDKSWEPDRAGFFKSPVYLKVDSDDEIIEREIFDLEYDEYLDILSEHAYRGDNDGWEDVNLYDFNEDPVYIRARFVYTIEDPENGKYINFISPWSEEVRVEERIIIDENIAPPDISFVTAPEAILADKAVTIITECDEETKDAIMKLSHFDSETEISVEYSSDGRNYTKVISDEDFIPGGKYTFSVSDVEKMNEIYVRCKIRSDGSEKYDIEPMDSGFSEAVKITLVKKEDPDKDKEPEILPPTPEKPEERSFPIIPVIIIPVFIAAAVVWVMIFRKIKK